MNFPSSFRYATLVWLTGLCTAPTVFVVLMALNTRLNFLDSVWNGRWVWWELTQITAVWSIPGWLLFMRATYLVCKTGWGKWEKKWTLFWVALALILVSSVIFSRNDYTIQLFYWIPGILGVFVLRLPKTDPKPSELNDGI